MNLLCPNCQKPLTVPDQYAGQLMKCPLCNGTFGVPGLPPPPAPPPAPEPEVFKLTPEPPRPKPESSSVSAKSESPKTEAPAPPPPPLPPSGYERTFSLVLIPQAMAWIAPVALGLIFLLLFMPWVSVYEFPKKEWYSQLGWGTGFGSEWSLLGAFYILLLFPTIALAIAVAIVPLLPMKLPPPVDKILAWRAAILAAVILLPTLILFAQIAVFGFGLEQVVKTTADGPKDPKPPENLQGRLMTKETNRDVAQATLVRTFWLDMVVLLSLVALAGAGLDACLQFRGNRLPPRLDVMW